MESPAQGSDLLPSNSSLTTSRPACGLVVGRRGAEEGWGGLATATRWRGPKAGAAGRAQGETLSNIVRRLRDWDRVDLLGFAGAADEEEAEESPDAEDDEGEFIGDERSGLLSLSSKSTNWSFLKL